MYGVTEYLMIMREDAKARLPSAGSKRTEYPSNRTAQEVLDDHLDPSEHKSSENPLSPKFENLDLPRTRVNRDYSGFQ